ncbi:hypothetical protein [Crocinitomix algicola]|uniref:hypothetical protein n=1 Tax=Crocinitomix algicola TaxID=1740263 RepID=UPI0008734811|nr:hypothetical protein [Crocinitomix algicola]
MKIYFYLAICVGIFASCKSYVQVFNTASNIGENEHGNYVYETDTVRITYSFWEENGVMTFEIFNKTKSPIYIDWKKSSYIDNSVKLNYWADVEKTSSQIVYDNYLFKKSSESASKKNTITGVSQTSSTKMERITFIPPNSSYFRSQFYIYPVSAFLLNTKTNSEEVLRKDDNSKKTKIYKANYNLETTPLIFRNFLTISFSEEIEDEFYIDNKFYISEVLEMERDHFEQYRYDTSVKGKWFLRDEYGNPILFNDFESPKSFYIKIPKVASITKRK